MCSLVASNLHLETKGIWLSELSAIIFWLISLSVCETAGSFREKNYSPPSPAVLQFVNVKWKRSQIKKKFFFAQFLKFISKSLKRVKVLISLLIDIFQEKLLFMFLYVWYTLLSTQMQKRKSDARVICEAKKNRLGSL